MITHRPIFRFSGGMGLFDRVLRVFAPKSECSSSPLLCPSNNSDRSRKFLSQIPQTFGVRALKDLKIGSHLHSDVTAASAGNFNVLPRMAGNLGANLDPKKVKETVSLHKNFSSFIPSSSQNEFETGRNSRSMNFVRGIIEREGMDFRRGSQFGGHGVEHNADIVHVKLIRNNTFVTVTDSKGNKKAGASSGCLSEMKGGPKLSRYSAEATAEHVGRLARNMGVKSVVMKVNGFIHFKKKKQAILSFREGYTHSRGDRNPIVYIEDTTRKPHNGCRLRKKRRV